MILLELMEANRAYLAAWHPWAAEQSFDDTLEYIRKARVQLEANDGFPVAILAGGELRVLSTTSSSIGESDPPRSPPGRRPRPSRLRGGG
jgi:hypothetical protein